MKKIILSFFVFSYSLLFAVEKHSSIVYTIQGNAQEAYYVMMDKPIKALGYRLPDPHKKVNDVYAKKYGDTHLEILNFITIIHDEKLKPLLEIEPKLAGFNPFNLVSYKHKERNETVISHLTASVIFEILNITNTKVIEEYTQLMKELDVLIMQTFPHSKVTYNSYTHHFKDALLEFESIFERPKDLDDYIDEVQENIEDTFIKKGYIMAGFFDYKQNNPQNLASYDAFWTYSLCHYAFSNAIFDNKNAMPEASVLAPCTIYLYIKKGTNTLHIGMPKIENWESLFPLNSQNRKDFIQKLAEEIPSTFIKLGFHS